MGRKDSYCAPVKSRHGNMVSGGAARLVRTAAIEGGIDGIVERAARQAARAVLEEVNAEVRSQRRSELRLLRGGKHAA